MIRILNYGHSTTRNCCYYKIIPKDFTFEGINKKGWQVTKMKALADIYCIENRTKLDKNQLRNFKLELFKCFLNKRRF